MDYLLVLVSLHQNFGDLAYALFTLFNLYKKKPEV